MEQINRLFTGLVAAGVALAVAGSVFRERAGVTSPGCRGGSSPG
ncbi:MAG: hypothetical protein R2713_05135 [Ilumatobacteraceae bacterium]